MYLIKNLYVDYINNSQNSIRKKNYPVFKKIGKKFEQILHQRTYVDGK